MAGPARPPTTVLMDTCDNLCYIVIDCLMVNPMPITSCLSEIFPPKKYQPFEIDSITTEACITLSK